MHTTFYQAKIRSDQVITVRYKWPVADNMKVLLNYKKFS